MPFLYLIEVCLLNADFPTITIITVFQGDFWKRHFRVGVLPPVLVGFKPFESYFVEKLTPNFSNLRINICRRCIVRTRNGFKNEIYSIAPEINSLGNSHNGVLLLSDRESFPHLFP